MLEESPNMCALLVDAAQGTAHVEDYTADFWKSDVLPKQTRAHKELKRLGGLVSMTLVECGNANAAYPGSRVRSTPMLRQPSPSDATSVADRIAQLVKT